MITPGRIGWAGHVAGMEDNTYILTAKPLGRKSVRMPWHRMKDDIKINLKQYSKVRTSDIRRSGQGPVVRSRERITEPCASFNGGKFTDQLGDYQLLNTDRIPSTCISYGQE